MDIITKSLLDNFIYKFGFAEFLMEPEKFEHFSAFTLLSQEINGNLQKKDLETISTGKAKGVDTIAFSINEKLILNSQEIDNFDRQSLSVDIFFIQSKTAEQFSDKELANFLDVVIDFFSNNPRYKIAEFDIAKDIYQKLLKIIDRVEINLHCLYVSLGQKQEEETSMTMTENIKTEQLRRYNLFQNINVKFIDKSILIKLHKKAINPLRATIKFENKIQLNNINGVEEAYIGFIPFSEFKNLIMESDSEIKIKSLFNDNLRDFLGLDNPINQGIKKTLEDKKFNEFSLLNNGVTVIADSNKGKGNTLILENYQIVNGCQTSNVLFECKDISQIEQVIVPLKVVITKNEELRDEIILTTNSQSKFTEEQLFAITQFQKTLEDYYKSNQIQDSLYYERRTNQYSSLQISRTDIIEIKEQLKSFMAMFFDFPHIVAGNIGKILEHHRDKFFQKFHNPMPYYISGLLSNKWDHFLFRHNNYKKFNKYRYHIFMGFRYLVENSQFEEKFLKNNKKYNFEKLLLTIRNNNELEKYIVIAIQLFEQLNYNKAKAAYSNTITQEYKKLLEKHQTNNKESCKSPLN